MPLQKFLKQSSIMCCNRKLTIKKQTSLLILQGWNSVMQGNKTRFMYHPSLS